MENFENWVPELTVKTVAKFLQTSEDHVRVLVRKRVIPHYRVGGRIRFDQEQIHTWLANYVTKVEAVA